MREAPESAGASAMRERHLTAPATYPATSLACRFDLRLMTPFFPRFTSVDEWHLYWEKTLNLTPFMPLCARVMPKAWHDCEPPRFRSGASTSVIALYFPADAHYSVVLRRPPGSRAPPSWSLPPDSGFLPGVRFLPVAFLGASQREKQLDPSPGEVKKSCSPAPRTSHLIRSSAPLS